MKQQHWKRLLWREWASCDFEDDAYLDELLSLAGDMRGGVLGAVFVPFWFVVWLPLVSWQMMGFFLTIATYFQGLDFVDSLNSVGALAAGATVLILGSAIACGALCRWRHLLAGFACARCGLALYGRLGEHLAKPPDDTPVVKVCCGMFVFGVAIAVLVGVACVFGLYDLGWAGAIITRACLAIAGALSVAPLVVVIGAAVASCKGKGPSAGSIRRFCFWWRPRPDYSRVEDALLILGNDQTKQLVARAQSAELDAKTLSKWVNRLQGASWENRFAARHICIRYGGLVVETLSTKKTDVAKSVLRCICADTAGRLRSGRFMCPDCLCRIMRHQLGAYRFWGCRRCRRSHDVLGPGRRIVAVLDAIASGLNVAISSGNVRVNWLAGGELFDFDCAEINSASDEQVELFAAEVRNETDPFRRALLAKSQCHVSAGHKLQENTIRILRQAFRRVTIGKSACARYGNPSLSQTQIAS